MEKTDPRYAQYVQVLREELLPAMGCTEPIAIAYAAAKARAVLGALPERLLVEVSGNIIKNVKSVVVPHTGGLRGIAAAAAAGAVAGDAEAELEVLSRVTEEQIAATAAFLKSAGIEVRHIATGRNVPMYKTNIQTAKAGPFFGPMVCSMRPMTPENAKLAYDITVKMPNVHGAPVHMGDPAEIGIRDIMQPDYGEAVDIYPGEIPVFWPCGVTPQAAVENARPPLVVTHSPGHMFITDIENAGLNDYLEALKTK